MGGGGEPALIISKNIKAKAKTENCASTSIDVLMYGCQMVLIKILVVIDEKFVTLSPSLTKIYMIQEFMDKYITSHILDSIVIFISF